MSIKWISYIWDKTDYRQGERLVALSLADFANDEGECFPYLETIARKANVSVRQVQRILRNFEGDGFIEMVNRPGRGIKPQFKLKKVTSATPFKDREKVTSATKKGDIQNKKKVTSRTSYIKDEPSLEPSGTGIESIAPELAIQAAEDAFKISLDLDTKRRITKAIIPSLIHLWPAYVNGRAIGWTDKSRTEKLNKLGYALTDFLKENKTNGKSARNGFLH